MYLSNAFTVHLHVLKASAPPHRNRQITRCIKGLEIPYRFKVWVLSSNVDFASDDPILYKKGSPLPQIAMY